MSSVVVMQYMGFEAKDAFREYTFAVRESGGAAREYTLTITNEAFVSHRVRYQDAPDICSLRLHREFAAHDNHPPTSQFSVSDEELADYHEARRPKPSANPYRPRQD